MNIVKYNHMFKMLIELAFEPKKYNKNEQRPLLLLEMMRLQSSQSQNGCQ